MIREKLIFWPLLILFLSVLVFGITLQGKKREVTKGLLQDIELSTEKINAEKKVFREKWDFDKVKAVDALDRYEMLLERSPFFRSRVESGLGKVAVIPIKEEPKKPILEYKGRAMLGSKVMVVIEEQGTGKSFFVQEGNMVGDFQVLSIYEKEVVFKKEGGEEIILNTVGK